MGGLRMGGKGGSKGIVRDRLISRFLSEVEGPFTVNDAIIHMKGWGLRNIPTVREVGMCLKRHEGVINTGKATPMQSRMMAERAGLHQSNLRKTTLYIKVDDLASFGEEE